MQSHAAMTQASLCKDSLQAHWPKSFQEVLASLVLHVAPIESPIIGRWSMTSGHASIKQMLYLGYVWWFTLFTLQQLPVNYFLSQQVVGDAARPSHAESRLV